MTTLPQTTAVRLPQPGGVHVPAASASALAGPGMLSGNQMTPGDVWRVIRSNAWLIAILLVVFAVGGYFAYVLLAKYYPEYTARGYLQVDTSWQTDPVTGQNYEMPETRLLSELRTQAQLLRNPVLFSNVLKDQLSGIRDTSWYKQFGGAAGLQKAKEDLRDDFRAVPLPDSKLVEVSFACANPSDARVVLKTLVDEHLRVQRDDSRDRKQELTNSLDKRKDALDQQIRDSSERRKGIQKALANGGMEGVNVFSTVEAELKVLLEAELKLEQDSAETSAMYEQAKQQLAAGGTVPQVEQMVDNDPMVQMLTRELTFGRIERDTTASTGSLRLDVTKMDARIKTMTDQLEARRVEVRQIVLEQLRSRADSTGMFLDTIKKRVEEARNRMVNLAGGMADLAIEQDKEKALREQLMQVDKRIYDLQYYQNTATSTRVAWATNGQPEEPDIPSFPKLAYVLPTSIFMGLALALGIAFLREFLDQTVRSPRDVARVGHMNLLGIIADEADDPQVANAQLAIFDAPHSITAEQFRQVRTRLQHAASLDTIRSIMVTGPGPMDGKTTVAANLAGGSGPQRAQDPAGGRQPPPAGTASNLRAQQ